MDGFNDKIDKDSIFAVVNFIHFRKDRVSCLWVFPISAGGGGTDALFLSSGIFYTVTYGFILYTIFSFIVYVRMVYHTTLWRIFRKFLYGEFEVPERVSFFKIKLLGFIYASRITFISGVSTYLYMHGIVVQSTSIFFLMIDFGAVFLVNFISVKIILDIIYEITGGTIFGVKIPLIEFSSKREREVAECGLQLSKSVSSSSKGCHDTYLNPRRVGLNQYDYAMRITDLKWRKGRFAEVVASCESIPGKPYNSALADLRCIGLNYFTPWEELSLGDKVKVIHAKSHLIYKSLDFKFSPSRMDEAYLRSFKSKLEVSYCGVRSADKLEGSNLLSSEVLDPVKYISDCSKYVELQVGTGKFDLGDSPLTKCIESIPEKNQLAVLETLNNNLLVSYSQGDTNLLLKSIYGESIPMPLTDQVNWATKSIRSESWKLIGGKLDLIERPDPLGDQLLTFTTSEGATKHILIEQKFAKGIQANNNKTHYLDFEDLFSYFYPIDTDCSEISQIHKKGAVHFEIFEKSVCVGRSLDLNPVIQNSIIPNLKKVNITSYSILNTNPEVSFILSNPACLPETIKFVKTDRSFIFEVNELDYIDHVISVFQSKLDTESSESLSKTWVKSKVTVKSNVYEAETYKYEEILGYLRAYKSYVEKLNKAGINLTRSFAGYYKNQI